MVYSIRLFILLMKMKIKFKDPLEIILMYGYISKVKLRKLILP